MDIPGNLYPRIVNCLITNFVKKNIKFSLYNTDGLSKDIHLGVNPYVYGNNNISNYRKDRACQYFVGSYFWCGRAWDNCRID